MSADNTRRLSKGVTNGCIDANRQTRLSLPHSTVRLEDGPAGTIARVKRPGEPADYAGPLADETVAALRGLARRHNWGGRNE